jgi:hypothetical protein
VRFDDAVREQRELNRVPVDRSLVVVLVFGGFLVDRGQRFGREVDAVPLDLAVEDATGVAKK